MNRRFKRSPSSDFGAGSVGSHAFAGDVGFAAADGWTARGFGALWSGLSSLVIYGGSMQFALLEPLGQAFAPLTIALLTLLIQARHIFYGLSMLDKYSPLSSRRKPYLIFSLTDETYSLVCSGAPAGVDADRWYTAVSVLDQLYWFSGTLIGALVGSLISTEALTGIDFSMTALFTVIVTEQSMDALRRVRQGDISVTEALFAPLLGGGATLLSLLLVGKGSFLLVAMAAMFAGFGARWFASEGRRSA